MIDSDFYGDRHRWFTGVVKDIGDDRSRVRVRIFGIHHTEDLEKVSDGDLPWALVLYPTTGGQTSGGNASHNLTPGTWVVGFFMDGTDSQQPIVTGVINGGRGSIDTSPPATNNDPTNPISQVSDPAKAAIDNPAENQTPTSQLEGGTNVQKVYNYFWQKISQEGSSSGDLKAIVSAIVGNFQQEAGKNIDPQAHNPSDKGEASYGIAQWRAGKYDRYTPLLKFCGISSPVKPPNLPPLEKQLDFVWHEFHTTERSAYNKLLAATTIQDATAGIIHFERDESYKRGTVDRTNRSYIAKLNNARNIYSSISYTGSSTSKSPSA